MTLKQFETILKQVHPSLHLKVRGYGDIIGLYAGNGYICRLTKGDLAVNGYRIERIDPTNPLSVMTGDIKKRGRKTVINILRNYRWVKHHKQRSALMGYCKLEGNSL